MEGREYNQNMNREGNRTSYSATAVHSPWHSPVPYLFGGLAAMLGLIAFALLILACSYWRLSGYLDGGGEGGNPGGERDLEAGEGGGGGGDAKKCPEKFLVIMAGDVKPTYLATPASNSSSASTSRSSSFMETDKSCTCGDDEDDDEEEEGGSDQVRQQSTGGNGAPTTSVQRR